MKLWNPFRKSMTVFNIDKYVLKQVKKDKDTIYGARSIKKHIGPFARDTSDYDIYTKNPVKSANKLQNNLDKVSGGDNYYSKPALHPGTEKVYNNGLDEKQGTKDDIHIADFSRPTRKVKIVRREGIKYTALSESVRDKKKILTEKEFEFRWKKDKDDLNRIKEYNKFKRLR